MSETGRAAVFFDFDNTLLAVDSGELGIRYLYEHGEIPLSFALRILIYSKLYNAGLYSPEQMALSCLRFYKGRELAYFERESEAYYREMLKPRLSRPMLARLEEHRARGDVLVILSASIRYMLEPARRDLGFDYLLCTDLEEDTRGLLTGRPRDVVLLGEHKARLAKRLAAEIGLDLSRSTAYSDHHSDVPMLEMVGTAYAVAPTKALRRLAQARGWEILSHE